MIYLHYVPIDKQQLSKMQVISTELKNIIIHKNLQLSWKNQKCKNMLPWLDRFR
jgi:hypothetical protein